MGTAQRIAGSAVMTPEQIEKLRAQFESWIKSPPYERLAVRFPETDATWPGSYRAIDIDLAWQAWQECALRAAAAQEAKS